MRIFLNLAILTIALIFLFSCEQKQVKETEETLSYVAPVNWKKRVIDLSKIKDSLITGKTYLSVYPQIYSSTMHKTYDLTTTVSIRNINQKDSVFILNVDYFNTEGKLIRHYFDKPVFVAPMETIEIVIEQLDSEGGTGANFIFDWKIKSNSNEPYFEAVMISTLGSQGLSFTTQGKKIDLKE